MKKMFRNNKFQNQQISQIHEKINTTEYKINLLVIGENKTGKSSLITKSVNDQFSETYNPTKEDIYSHKYKNAKINILDTGYQSKQLLFL